MIKTFNKFKTKGDFTLIKVSGFRPSWVAVGQNITGWLDVMKKKDEITVRVSESLSNYIRTSPVLKILSVSNDVLFFQTHGGVYKLERKV